MAQYHPITPPDRSPPRTVPPIPIAPRKKRHGHTIDISRDNRDGGVSTHIPPNNNAVIPSHNVISTTLIASSVMKISPIIVVYRRTL